MIKAVLFDLDETLLDINLVAFVTAYGMRFSKLVAEIGGMGRLGVSRAYLQATLRMSEQDREDDLTNHEFFCREFEAETGIPLDDPVIAEAVEAFEEEVLPKLNTPLVHARPRKGGLETIEAARKEGLVVALATNPSFTEAAIRTRMGWAGLTFDDFAYVSHSGNSHRVKPSARYYLDFCRQIGVGAHECLMVGNDAWRDFPTPDIGIEVAYVGRRHPKRAYWQGDMTLLAKELPSVVGRLNSKGFEPDLILNANDWHANGHGEKDQEVV